NDSAGRYASRADLPEVIGGSKRSGAPLAYSAGEVRPASGRAITQHECDAGHLTEPMAGRKNPCDSELYDGTLRAIGLRTTGRADHGNHIKKLHLSRKPRS